MANSKTRVIPSAHRFYIGCKLPETRTLTSFWLEPRYTEKPVAKVNVNNVPRNGSFHQIRTATLHKGYLN